MTEALINFFQGTGFANISWQQAVMILVSFVLMYLAIVKKFEPLLLLPIAFGMFLANFPLGGVNDLPLSLVLCWFEQKAVCILIALLALGIRNIRLGPTLPPFLSPGVVRTLQERYGLKPIATPEADLQAILGG